MNITYEQLMFALDHGEEVTFQDKEGRYVIIGGAWKDKFGNYRGSDWNKGTNECEKRVGEFNGYSKEDLEHNLKKMTYISSKPTRYAPTVPVGTKVRILENAQEECEKYKTNIKEEMIGFVTTIERHECSDYALEGLAYIIPRTAFTVITGEKNKMEDLSTEEMIKELERRGDIQDRKVII